MENYVTSCNLSVIRKQSYYLGQMNLSYFSPFQFSFFIVRLSACLVSCFQVLKFQFLHVYVSCAVFRVQGLVLVFPEQFTASSTFVPFCLCFSICHNKVLLFVEFRHAFVCPRRHAWVHTEQIQSYSKCTDQEGRCHNRCGC